MPDSNRALKVVIVNRHYPPRTGVTGEAACRLARYLETNTAAKVTIVSCQSNYDGGGDRLEPVGDQQLIKSLYDGKNKLIRLFSSFIESYLLIRKARLTEPDRIIVMTDPPFLQFWAALLLAEKYPWTLWSMDIFPDAFVSSGLVKPSNYLYRFLKYITYRKKPDSLIALGPLQADYLQRAYVDPIESVAIVPCGAYKPENRSIEQPIWKLKNSDKIILGYCGNLGEAHSVEFLKQIISHLDPAKFHLVLSVYGTQATDILEFAKSKTAGISIEPRVDRQQMGFIDIHLVSLLKNWSHVCVPSKAVSAICSGRPILLYGTSDCDNWKMLGSGGWLIPQSSNPNDVSKSVKDFLDLVDQSVIETKKQGANLTASRLRELTEEGYRQVAQHIGLDVESVEQNAIVPEYVQD